MKKLNIYKKIEINKLYDNINFFLSLINLNNNSNMKLFKITILLNK